MGSLTVTEFMTLDGVGQAPGGPEEDRAGGFAHGGWQALFVDHESAAVVFGQAKTMDALLLGRRTYEIFAAYWPTAPKEIPFTALLNRVPKHVATRMLRGPLAWEGASVVTSELAELKRRYAEIHAIGSLDLVQPLLRAGLVDRLRLWQFPLLLGDGKRVFADGTVPAALRLTESTPYPNGTLQLTYELAGAPEYGDLS